jgi:ComF family protein
MRPSLRPFGDLLDLLWPRYCLACGRPVRDEAPPLELCPGCRARLTAVDPRASCATCARPLADGPQLQRCGECLADPPAFERLTALWRYETPLKEVVLAFKFGRLDFLGAHLAHGLAEALLSRWRADERCLPPALVVPIPLPWPRRLVRGFNQTELIAAPLAGELGLPWLRALGRDLLAPRQTGQRRRGRSLAGHFRVRTPGAIAGLPVLLVDDVLTTGATVRSASAALKRAGAGPIEVAVAGWTPLDEPLSGGIDSP